MNFKIWKTIKIGGTSKDKVLKQLEEKNIYVSDWAKDILEKTEFQEKEENVDLVKITVRELGFKGYPTTDEIYQKASELGLELCPSEVGPLLRLQSKIKDWTLIAMKQILDRGGVPIVFSLGSDVGRLELYGSDARPGRQWGSDDKFVFRFRKFDTSETSEILKSDTLDFDPLKLENTAHSIINYFMHKGATVSKEDYDFVLDKIK